MKLKEKGGSTKTALAVAKPPQHDETHGWLNSTLQSGRDLVRIKRTRQRTHPQSPLLYWQ
jgi:hypothetical protein